MNLNKWIFNEWTFNEWIFMALLVALGGVGGAVFGVLLWGCQ